MKAIRFLAPAFLGFLLLAGCREKQAEANPPAAAGSPAAGEPAPVPAPEPAPFPGPAPGAGRGWKTTSWANPRGGFGLQGRVHDPVPRAPAVEWSIELDGPVLADAAIADGTVYVGTVIGTFYAVDLATGEERWKFAAEDTIEAPPTVALGRVFVGSNDRFFYCLDQEKGTVIWKVEGADKFICGSLVARSPDDREDWVIVNGYDGICRCLRVADGTVVWTYQTDDQINSTPTLLDEKTVVFGGCDMVVHTITIAEGKKVNEVQVDAEIVGDLVAVGTMTYSANYANQLVAADAFADKAAWVYEDQDFPFFASPAVNDEMVFIGSRDKHLHAVDRASGKRVWKAKTGSRVDGSAIVFDDAVVFGSRDGRLYALNPKDGEEIWRLDLGEGFDSSPAFCGGRIVLGGTEGTLFCIKGEPSHE